MTSLDRSLPQNATLQRQGWYDTGRTFLFVGLGAFILLPMMYISNFGGLLVLGYFCLASGSVMVLTHFYRWPTYPLLFIFGISFVDVGVLAPAFYVWGKGDLTTAMSFALLGASTALSGWRLVYLATRPYRGPK